MLFFCVSASYANADSNNEQIEKYKLVKKVHASYPLPALRKGIQGTCTIEYTVTETGKTADHKVKKCKHRVFSSASVAAAKKFRYKPQMKDGKAVSVKGVNNTFTFKVSR